MLVGGEKMSFICCDNRRYCTIAAIIVSTIVGIVFAFTLISGGVVIDPIYVSVALGVGLVYLAATLIAVAIASLRFRGMGASSELIALIIGILGTIIFSIVVYLVGVTAVTVGLAVLVGFLGAFFALMITSTICFIKYLANGREA